MDIPRTSMPCRISLAVAILAVSLGWLVASPAFAQGKLDATYEATLAGLSIGKGTWTIDITGDQFSATVSGGTTGLMKSIGGGQGTGTSQGKIVAGQFAPLSYTSTVLYSKKAETIHIALSNGNVKDFSIEPEPPINPERIPVTEAHRRSVLDPMTASLLRVPDTVDPVGPEACRKLTSIFDGRMRYDLHLEYKRTDMVKAAKGYQGYLGPAVVCSVYFTPIAGYIPDQFAIKYLATQRDMEVWFAPILGTRVLVPFRILVPTPLGLGMIEATEFISSPKAAKTN